MNARDPIKSSKSSCKEGAVHIWHLDECVVAINGKKQWLWRAVDQDGFVLDVLVQSRRNAKASDA
ncbi:transposase-like protein [Rhizobium leguminosarum]